MNASPLHCCRRTHTRRKILGALRKAARRRMRQLGQWRAITLAEHNRADVTAIDAELVLLAQVVNQTDISTEPRT